MSQIDRDIEQLRGTFGDDTESIYRGLAVASRELEVSFPGDHARQSARCASIGKHRDPCSMSGARDRSTSLTSFS